ncbi:MAG: EamA family transporter [Myxococcales bacterium]|nr:MAG: EamA family transporter [Myxococcales bacterium]
MTWLAYALLSAFAASVTAILTKVGVQGVPSHVATTVRTAVVLVFSAGLMFGTREHQAFREIRGRPLLFLLLSGVATGVSWLAYFRALQMAPASQVAPIDKLSLAITVALAAVFLGEPVSWKLGLGAGLMVAGALITLT